VIIDTAERPLILAGHGVILSNAFAELRTFAERASIPVVTTLLGISAIPESHPLALGLPGMHGRAEINHAIHKADVLIAVGMRFDDRVTGNVSHFAPQAKIIHIDIDPSEMGKVLAPAVPIVADARIALEALTKHVSATSRDDWMEAIQNWRREAEAHGETPTADSDAVVADGSPRPQQILVAIRKATEGRALMVSDVGQHQMWMARFYGYEHPNTHLTSGGLGTMGYALPAAMGVAFGRPEQPIWVVAGDGGIQMNIQELATIAEFQVPIKVAIFNNGYLGMVRQWQQFFHKRNYSEVRITGPDYVKLAAAYGISGFQVTRADDVTGVIEQAMAIDGPVIIDFVMEQEANVFPMVPPGKGNVDMIHKAPATGGNQ
jgi:acetolactate synthase-1/2/3 large subunit